MDLGTQKEHDMASIRDFKVGDKVRFGRGRGEQTLGTVVKVNRAKLKVRQDEVRGRQRIRPAGTIWTVPPSLCTKVSGSEATPKAPSKAALKAARSDAEIIADITRVYGNLSPENLWMDGEASRSYVQRRGAQLRQALRVLFAEIGREVTESEAYGDKPYAGETTPVSRRAPVGTAKSNAIDPTAPIICNYRTGDWIRNATAAEADASREAAITDGGAGVIEIDGVACYVED